jgi:hypothetical protein
MNTTIATSTASELKSILSNPRITKDYKQVVRSEMAKRIYIGNGGNNYAIHH